MALLIDDEAEQLRAISNPKGQYSIWPINVDLPPGWTESVAGSRDYCLDEIDRLWKDIHLGRKSQTDY
ncbi:MbtH family NRPS accessory protein [Verminephrobacter aporrectodeae]|uniref:MbtH family NRPS accessory protein n=1 Tax=Verminephrobacter aporrectodeae TaxID=1110389 RepID=UPI002A678FC9|nr:MbtH family protein [Verminephrobacter aporrectodeae subsp. tuberculatae]MCW8177554.1 MbtH family protein [Verminephrobacter aporrectodeae subsp. tuberculatae]MCW8204907.1 MbtH family protein [Verminephrobacter aporrectodeae subsp. tuberculatae]MCW8207775.1 MbtH family protein [Verminephrobacter aporrectodeae subsp. tuberculatae]